MTTTILSSFLAGLALGLIVGVLIGVGGVVWRVYCWSKQHHRHQREIDHGTWKCSMKNCPICDPKLPEGKILGVL